MTTSATALVTGVPIRARDGTRLVTDAYLPSLVTSSPAPTVMLRTPYGRAAHRQEGLAWAERGFAFVAQDVRGRYDSDGTWELYCHERADGAALVDWITTQPWSDGRIAAVGGSYSGFTAWAAALTRPHAVRAVISTGPAMGLDRVKWDPSGILRLAEHTTWWLERAESRTSRDGLVRAVFTQDPQLLTHLPVLDIPTRAGAHLPRWSAVVTEGPDIPGPEAISTKELAAWPGAALHIGGRYDLLLGETLEHWHAVGSTLTPRPPRGLLVGPWDHSFGAGPGTAVGAWAHGSDSRLGLGDLQVQWLRQVLDAGPAPIDLPQLVRVFEVGTGWRDHQHWPPATTSMVLWPHPDGRLLPDSPATSISAFIHDPVDPYPSRDPGADRAELLERADAARFRTAPLATGMHLAGRPQVHLAGASAETDSDWVVRLLEQRPDGTLLALAQSAVTRARAGVGPWLLDLDDVSIAIPAGSQLMLEVTGADFPYLARNLGTPADRYSTTGITTVTQQLRLGLTTRLELPVWTPGHP